MKKSCQMVVWSSYALSNSIKMRSIGDHLTQVLLPPLKYHQNPQRCAQCTGYTRMNELLDWASMYTYAFASIDCYRLLSLHFWKNGLFILYLMMIVIIINKPMIIDLNKNSNKMREWNGQRIFRTHTRSRVHWSMITLFYFVVPFRANHIAYISEQYRKKCWRKKIDTFKSSLK